MGRRRPRNESTDSDASDAGESGSSTMSGLGQNKTVAFMTAMLRNSSTRSVILVLTTLVVSIKWFPFSCLLPVELENNTFIRYTYGFAILSIAYYFIRRVAQGGTCTYRRDLEGRVAIVTGGNTGIGYETAKALAEMGATVVLACRDVAKGKAAAKAISADLPLSNESNVKCLYLDLSKYESVDDFADAIIKIGLRVDILVNNAGVMMTPKYGTIEGTDIEYQFGVNHVGHFLLTLRLLDILESCNGRVVNVSSFAHWQAVYSHGNTIDRMIHSSPKEYSPVKAYGASKAANILFTRRLQQEFEEAHSRATAYAVHPGVVNTDICRHFPAPLRKIADAFMFLFMKTPVQGAQTSIFCAVHPDAVPGAYHQDCRDVPTSPLAASDELASELWDKSIDLLNSKTR